MIAGVEGGGTKFVAVVAEAARPDVIVERRVVPTTTAERTLGEVAEFLRRFALEGVGIASFGPLGVDPAGAHYGRLLGTPKAAWQGVDLVAGLGLSGPNRAPIAVETDVNAAAIAEARVGREPCVCDLVYVTVGTGIGIGLIVSGRPVHGRLHPEAGHLRVRRSASDRFPGVCAWHGDCLEGLASGPALAARAGRDPSDVPPEDPLWTRVAEELAEGVASLVLTLAPSEVRVGGGVGLRPGLCESVAQRVEVLLGGYLPTPPIERARHGSDAGPLGALALAAALVAG